MDVVILGAGVLGVSLAYHLSNLGIKSVILEKESVAAFHASGRNAGMLRQLYHHPQLTEWAKITINEMPANLKEQYFVKTGSIVVGRKIPDHHQELFKQEENAVRCNSDGLLDSGPYVQSLLRLADKTKCHFNIEIIEIIKKHNFWQLITKQGQKFEAKLLVNASGAWAEELIKDRISLKAYARHLALIEGFPEDYMPAPDCGFYWDEQDAWYLRKWSKTSRLVSICDENPCKPECIPDSSKIKEEIAKTLLKNLPQVANSLRIANFWHCYRTYAKDRLPIIGLDTHDNSLFWLSGFGGFGMSTAYAACKDAARLISGELCPALDSFSPTRCDIL